ncbi:hypothetical protein [Nitratireductor luteus]|uniref:hypothetical protein n=1 Tax=Nitratireductor luteus TaxID=2976980 RepID=UPI00223F0E38|nr:hypothetical protein [Nitratireductor luteus]
MSSYTVRRIIGYELFAELEQAATHAQSPVATYVRALIAKSANGYVHEKGADRRTALQATFRGGKGSPLHDWFPYLEGYSPDFVGSIISEFAVTAKTILDPFCGSGTTALVSALRGRKGLYAEVNPVCQFVISAKASALAMSSRKRQDLSKRLLEIHDDLLRTLKSELPDVTLRNAYEAAFSGRPSFDDTSFNQILRARTVADKLSVDNPALGVLFTVAVLRSLVPGSLMIRRGDLRFRTTRELSRERPCFVSALQESLRIIASDLIDAEAASGTVQFIGADARQLSANLSAPVDAIITSPPYLNGTNYFRNTKLELWFLRQLSVKNQLRTYRDAAITSGINDVTVGKSRGNGMGALPSSLIETIEALEEDAYDQRIPMMVEAYFREMAVVLQNFKAVSHKDTVVAIDLGDSCYGDIGVPTHDIICDLMAENGFNRSELVVLRERQSRGGSKLSQTLQVFRPLQVGTTKTVKTVGGASAASSMRADHRIERWNLFRETLPHQRGVMAKRNWGHPWHSLCSYQGKLKASIAHTLTRALLPNEGGRTLDPFSGVGSIPFEARLQGHTAFGFDISPAAIAISRAKLEPVNCSAVENVIEALQLYIGKRRTKSVDLDSLNRIRFNGPLPAYFHPETLKEIVAAREFFIKNPPLTGSEALVFSALLHVLHGNRPYALSRRSHPITPFAPTGEFEYRGVIDRVQNKVDRALREAAGENLPKGKSYFQDATGTWPDEVADLDAIITSPPFFDSTRFHTANWMRLWFAGWEADDFSEKPATFVDERQKRSFAIYDAIFSQGAERLKPRGYFAVHLGKSAKCDMAGALAAVGGRHLDLVDSFAESVEHCESHGIRDKGTVTHHQYLLFRRR